MNTKLFLLLGTSLSLIPNLTFAQCVATQDCETLGYTETSCNGCKGVKCPFGNWWACLPTKESICKEEGFTLACNETGQTGDGDSCNGLYKQCACDSSYKYTCTGTACGGSGTACGGKYTACTCASGYIWKNGTCQKKNPCIDKSNGAYNEIYCCNDMVVGVRATDMKFYIAMKDLKGPYWPDANSQCQNYVFCGNLKGKLPSKDQLLTLYSYKSQVNSLLSNNGGTQLDNYYWSSTQYGSEALYAVTMSSGLVDWVYDTNNRSVRPVLTSW